MKRHVHMKEAAAVLLLLGVCVACERRADPGRYAASGDAYAAKQQYAEAIIEYRKALKEEPQSADIRYKLGRVYEQSGDPVNAYAEYARAGDIAPAHVDAQIRAGTLLLVAREFEAARTRAELALKADPQHALAHILLGNALAGLNQAAGALRQIEQAITLDPDYAPAWTALGAVTFLGGRKDEAGAAFQKAVELAPKSIDARLALANFQWANAALDEAERTLRAALDIEPASREAHRSLALLYVTTRRAEKAEPHFRALATDADGRIALADYYMGVRRNREALAILEEIARTAEKRQRRAALLRTATIHYGTGNKAEAHRIVDTLIAESARNAEAQTAKARMLLSDGAPPRTAMTYAQQAVKADASLLAAHYTLGLCAFAARDFVEAERAFEAAARLNPRASAPQAQLAKLRLARGDVGGAVAAAEVAARDRPDDPASAVLLAQTLRARGDVERAARELERRLASAPRSAALHTEMGHLLAQRGDHDAARHSFNEALRIDPSSMEARQGLVAADIAAKQFGMARIRASAWQADEPRNLAVKTLAARVELAAGNFTDGERLLREVVETDPAHLDAYELLGGAYAQQGRVADAIRQFEILASRSAEKATSARTMAGMLHEARGDRAAARAAYEKVLAADSRAGIAANNLAWIYVAEGRLDEALQLATVAQGALRRRPEPEDTAGWVYLKKGLTGEAIAAFERARSRAPQNPIYHYHLGLAYQQRGDTERAVAALSEALQLKADFVGAEDARRQLAALTEQRAGR